MQKKFQTGFVICIIFIIAVSLFSYVRNKASKAEERHVRDSRETQLGKPEVNRLYRFKLTKSWSQKFPSSRTEWLDGKILDRSVKYEIRPDGDDFRKRPANQIAAPNINDGVLLDNESINFVQWRIAPNERTEEADFIVTYTR